MGDIPDFRTWFKERHNISFPATIGEPEAVYIPRALDALADYADLLRYETLGLVPPPPVSSQDGE